MTHYDHQSPATGGGSTYPQLPQSSGSYVVGAPPPIGYPTQHNSTHASATVPVPVLVETKSRGDGFWKGCCAALCCCCVLDACF